MESSAAQTDDEIDLLDLLVVIAENLKLLILGPLFVGICALGIAFTLPQTYESQSTLNPQKPGLNVSGAMLASYIKSFDVLKKQRTISDSSQTAAHSNASKNWKNS